MKIGILTGGGDAPGINAVIRAVFMKGVRHYKYDFLGIRDGWRGILDGNFMELDLEMVSGILPRGGSILGNSRTNPFKHKLGAEKIFKNMEKAGLDAIVVIGGDDTLRVAHQMGELGLKCVGVPKTIDNDLPYTDYTFGFNTAVSIVTNALDRLHTTAESHNRAIVIEVMGRYTGWIAIEAGIAGGADVILIPEKPFKIDEVCKYIHRRKQRGKNFSIVVVAEGSKPEGGKEILFSEKIDDFGHVSFGGVGYYIGKEIEKQVGIETRVVVLGHLQRGGSPTAFDRLLATRYGIAAIDLIHKRNFGYMVALNGKKIVSVPLKNIVGKKKTVDLELYNVASVFFG
jgi:6-phosphofructokinase 1